MEVSVTMWAALLLLLSTATVASAAATTYRQDAGDPCEHHTCPSGEECVSHAVSCRRPPCARISECRATNCTLPCRAGFECARRPEPCSRPPCPLREQCVSQPDACGGKCLEDEVCLTSVQTKPCAREPCAISWCVSQGVALTARHQPPPPSFCGDCPPPAVCVHTQVCRQYNECLFLPVCLSNCTEMWCGLGYECRMQPPAICNRDECPPEPTCVPEDSALSTSTGGGDGGSGDGEGLDFELGNRFSGGEPRQPQCVVSCTEDEECRFMPTRCLEPPCPIVSRCVPLLTPTAAAAASVSGIGAGASAGAGAGTEVSVDVGDLHDGECPLDDLRQLASPAFCGAASLHQCSSDGECGTLQRCCARGCGRSCLPTCLPGCRQGTECRLVAVQCVGSPCPKVAECVAAEEPAFPAAAAAASIGRPVPPFFGTIPPFDAAFGKQPSAAAAAGSASASAGSASASASTSASTSDDERLSFDRPGLCPVNDPQTQSKICFDNGSVDRCADDGGCPTGHRCCLRGCQKLCRPVCDSCPSGLECQLSDRDGRPRCLTPVEDHQRGRFNNRVKG